MRQIMGTMIALCMAISVNAQFTIKGKITSKNTAVEAAVVILRSGNSELTSQATSAEGFFRISGIKKPGSYDLLVKHVGYMFKTITVNITTKETTVDIVLEEATLFLEPLEIKSTRAGERVPFAKQDISKSELAKNNLGQDIPFLLNQSPSVVVNSDAGNGIGYTGIRIRGTDASRINVTLNGIPYNDAESQGTFFVDLPDFTSSVNSIQVQRGVGTSSNGAGAFGATINLSTNEFNEKASGEVNNSYGSFNTWKHTVKAGSGLVNDHFTIDARLSKISSDGYVDRASSDLRSFYISGAYISKKSTVRLNIFSGAEKTYQSWYGIDSTTLKNHRTYNPAGTEKPGTPYDNQTDNYWQEHYQLFFNHSINKNWSFNTALFLVNGKGYYEQYRPQEQFSDYGLPNVSVGGTTITITDLVRQLWLDNAFYGQIASVQYKKAATQFTLGGGWNTYEGNHFGKVIWAETGFPKDHKWYDLTALKKDANVYAKWLRGISAHLDLFADIQFRHVDYSMNGFRDNPALFINREFNFLNPKTGITYHNNNWKAYLSYAMGNKEPNREDFEAATYQQPGAETLHDFEAGFEKKAPGYSFAANVYYMHYVNQLVLTGKINDVGAYTRINGGLSFRRGIELQGSKIFYPWLNVTGNITFSENRIKDFVEFIDDYDNGGQKQQMHHNTTLSFSPSIVGGLAVNFTPCSNTELSFLSKYVSRQYLDNTENMSRSLDPYFLEDARLSITIPNKIFSNLNIIAQVNNIFNKLYEPNGYTFSYFYLNRYTTENYYYPMAGTNFMIGLNIKF